MVKVLRAETFFIPQSTKYVSTLHCQWAGIKWILSLYAQAEGSDFTSDKSSPQNKKCSFYL